MNRISNTQPLSQQTFWRRALLELLQNSVHFPFVVFLLGLFLQGRPYLSGSEPYLLAGAAILQALVLTWWERNRMSRRLTGNVIAPATFTIGTVLLGGIGSIDPVTHAAFWVFAGLIGILQDLNEHATGRWWLRPVAKTGEGLLRSSLPLLAFTFFISITNEEYRSVDAFLSDESYLFLTVLMLFLAIVLSFSTNLSAHYLARLRDTLNQLAVYSEWLLGPTMLRQAIEDESQLNISRVVRTIMFMDIRNFTSWAEDRPPEAIVSLLNRYYRLAEEAAVEAQAIKFKFTGDEVMIVFAEPAEAVATARRLYTTVIELLGSKGLTVGVGIHTGPVAEGLLGSNRMKGYDVIGDTVNTAKRLEQAAQHGVIISERTFDLLPVSVSIQAAHTLKVKGKRSSLRAYTILPANESTAGRPQSSMPERAASLA